ncbi:MAG TPA: hypothetical protein VJY31_01490 [Buttiauxella sp.]|nr:hypothetical protein [Buttiauxella sp.]
MIFTLPEKNQEPTEWGEAPGAQGCDDARVGVGVTGRIALNFIRETQGAKQAVVSAIKDVKRIIPGAVLVEVMTDLVDLSAVTRQCNLQRELASLDKDVQKQLGQL